MKKIFYLAMVVIMVFCGTGVSLNDDTIAVREKTIYAQSLEQDSFGLEIMPNGGTPLYTDTERIDYAYKVEDRYYNPYELPTYLSSYTCGINAGGAAIGYYDRIYDELIPNHTGRTLLGKYIYAAQGAEVNNMYDSLYTRMNATSAGVTLNDYLNGIQSYVTSKGRTITYARAMNGANQLYATQYKNAFRDGKLVSLFVTGFNVMDFSDIKTNNNYDNVTLYVNAGSHIMIGYGYLDISYYNSSNQVFRTDTYMYVATGFSSPRLGMVKLNKHCGIDDAYIMDIK